MHVAGVHIFSLAQDNTIFQRSSQCNAHCSSSIDVVLDIYYISSTCIMIIRSDKSFIDSFSACLFCLVSTTIKYIAIIV